MPAHDLPTAAPATQGVDAAGVLAFLDDLTGTPDVELHSLMVLRHGHVVAQGWWRPYSPDRVHLLYSLSKTFTASALGLAVAEGLVDLDELVVDCLPDLAGGADPRTRTIRVRHLASMSTGHTYDTWEAARAADRDEPVRGFLGLPPERDPGTVFAYNQSATYTLATILQRRTGTTLLGYLRPRLLDPLGVGATTWQQHPEGRELGFSGLHAATDAVARLGQLYLQDGVWQGRRLLPEGWVAEATRAHVGTPDEPAPAVDWRQGYGFQVWRSQHGYRGDGAFGQFCLVLPEHDAVVAVTGQSEDMQRVLDAAWRHLLPAFGETASGERDDELAARLGRLELAAPAAAEDPTEPDRWSGAVLAPAGGSCADQPTLRRVQLDRDPTGGWTLTLHEDLDDLAVRLPRDGTAWALTEADGAAPVAAAGGWRDGGALRVEVAFLETPHRLVVTCADPTAGFEARWQTAPLHRSRLAGLRAPG